jgi:murein DD-endopeptidase MepM/ murein hydrolase activator NlpD
MTQIREIKEGSPPNEQDLKVLNAMLKWGKNGGWVNSNGEKQAVIPTQGILTSKHRWPHKGIDLANTTGTPIKAVAPGVVTFADFDQRGGYIIKIQHPDGSKTFYAHIAG